MSPNTFENTLPSVNLESKLKSILQKNQAIGYFIPTSSTSKIRVEFGGMGPEPCLHSQGLLE